MSPNAMKARPSKTDRHPGTGSGPAIAHDIAARLVDDIREIASPEVREATERMTDSQVQRFAEQVGAAALDIVRSAKSATEHSSALERLTSSVSPETARGLQTTENSYRQVGEEFGWLTSTEVSELVGSKTPNRELGVRLRREGRAFAVRRLNKFLFPAFQFDVHGRIDPTMQQLIRISREAGWDDDDLLLWLNAPTSRFDDDRRPVDHLKTDPNAVIDALEQTAADKW